MTATPTPPYEPLPRWSGNNSRHRGARSVWSILGVILAVAFGALMLIHLAFLVLIFVVTNSYGSNK